MNNLPLVLLLVYSAFAMNLTLQCGLGVKGAAVSKNIGKVSTAIKSAIIFITIILMWFIFSRINYSWFSGNYIYALLFPVSYIMYEGFDFLFFSYIFKRFSNEDCFIGYPGIVCAVAAFICLNIVDNIIEAIMLSFGFTAGMLIVFLIVREIRKRAALEAVPKFLRGKPLALISMGLLLMVFTAASLLFIGMIGNR